MGARPFSPRNTATVSNSPAGKARASAEPSSLVRRGREASALGLFALSTFTALSLASFRVDPNDPQLSGPDWMGPVGAAVAGFLVQGFGLVAWLAPIELAVVGAPLMRGRGIGPIGQRVLGDLVVAIVLSALLRVSAPELL